MARGECNCGAVQFEIDADLKDVYVCHCSICRRFTGSQGIAVVVFPRQQFRWLQGEDHVATWQKPGTDWHAYFCRVCGSAVPGENDPRTMFAPAGSITRGGESLAGTGRIVLDQGARNPGLARSVLELLLLLALRALGNDRLVEGRLAQGGGFGPENDPGAAAC